MDSPPEKTPSPLLSSVPVAVLVGLLYPAVRIFGGDTLEGASQVILLVATAVCIFLSVVFCGARWKDIEQAIVRNIAGVASALVILLLIGALAGIWMVGGIIPTLIYYGMKVIHPGFYLASTCLICALVSVITGSSWTTVATAGIALSGIGLAQGFSPGWIGGAIISGAYFGDKISPLSDTTVLASAVTATPLFVHIRYMMVTTVPSMAVALVIYTVAGLSGPAASTEEAALYSESISGAFYISPWLMSVPLLMVILIVKRVPAPVALFLGCLMACLCALIFQPHLLDGISGLEVAGVKSRFRGLLIAVYGNTSIDTGHSALNELVSTRGMAGMMNTVWLILCAMCFGGAMTASGMLRSIISVCLRFMKNTAGLVSSTVFSGIFFNICTGDQYLSIILTGDMYRDLYREKGYESRLLSRSTEDGVTVTSPLVPWNTCGMTQATVLGISTLTYLPYAFFNLASPLVSILVAAAGYRIFRHNDKHE
ncbi:MAG: sodium:proton antiporter [Tannerella sp.]|jgi:NhaC family Na+:H+ antiporter|nr:sodium:proton antiporter [Tannerella sp.]